MLSLSSQIGKEGPQFSSRCHFQVRIGCFLKIGLHWVDFVCIYKMKNSF